MFLRARETASAAREVIAYDGDEEPQKPVETITIGPQPGPQTAFLETVADIAIYGGAAGGGKSFALLLEPLRHIKNTKFGGVIFRRTSVQIRIQGGLWDESMKLYIPLGGYPRQATLDWVFEDGLRMKFAHLEYDNNVYDWQGAQIPYIGFDELTHFTEAQFFYMLSRNRSDSGVPGYVRATCNPDADSWVRKLIDWWIDEDGYAIPERSGVLRWFIRRDNTIIWGDTPEELKDMYGAEETPKSLTFIAAKLTDNQILMERDPSYLANLRALDRVERARLLGDKEKGGNWNVRSSQGNVFKRDWFPIVNAIPAGWVTAVRFWDRAATKPHEGNWDPDWTRGLLMLRYPDNSYLVADLRSARDSPGQVENLIKTTASHDSVRVRVMSQQDPGSAGKMEAVHFVRALQGYDARTMTTSRHKLTRAKPVSAQAEVGNVRVLRAPWNDDFFAELEAFPDGTHDDIVDTLSGAYNELSGAFGLLDVM